MSSSEHNVETDVKAYHCFLTLNHHKGGACKTPTAFVHFQTEGFMDAAHSLIAMNKDEVIRELDISSRFVQCLLTQMSTYDCTRQKIIALIFNERVVMSDVFNIEASE